MAAPIEQHRDRVAAYLKQKPDDAVSLADVVALAEITAQSLQSAFASIDGAIHRELVGIADYIRAMKVEIGGLHFNELKHTRIPAAGQELDAVVKATEAASNTIMECAEAVLAADAGDPTAFKAMVDQKMLVIFEACSFQDITGQRVAKVVETLKHIEARVARFVDAVRTKDTGRFVSAEERASAERKQRLILHGPELPGRGNGQGEVDRLMAKES
ncbi:MAG TPA: chemotaxis protein [Xanthobacteraceae bacterium]|nr:chemotaxis protein [Xanthobacteraceae bacterium]